MGDHRLMCGDSTDGAQVKRLMAGETAMLLATDPPYGVDYQDQDWDDSDEQQLLALYCDYLREALPHLAKFTAIYQWHAAKTDHLVKRAWAECGLHLHQTIIWVKPSGTPNLGRSHYMWRHEPCFYGWVKGQQPERRPFDDATTVWLIGRENDHIHPTQKPVEVFERPLEYHTQSGEVAYEPFCGSGSQIIAAERLSRRCFAMEKEPRYVDAVIDRWEKVTGKTAKKEPSPRRSNRLV